MSGRRQGLQLPPGWRLRTTPRSQRRSSPPREELPAFTPRRRENLTSLGPPRPRPKPRPTAAEMSAAVTTIQRAYRKTLPYIRSVLQRTKGSERLKNNELNKLAKIIHTYQIKGLNSPQNMIFFITKFPNKNNPFYINTIRVLKPSLKVRANQIKIKKGVSILSNAYSKHQNKLRANEYQRTINNLSRLVNSSRTGYSEHREALRGQQATGGTAAGQSQVIGVSQLRKPIPPTRLSNAKTIAQLELMISSIPINSPRFINAKKFVKNTFPNLTNEPTAPNRTGMKPPAYTIAKRNYESNVRNWLKSAARRWFRNRGAK